jgi:Putative transmembrane family 234
MPKVVDLCCMVLVGALWGCTNPLLRMGDADLSKEQDDGTRKTKDTSFLVRQLSKFRHISVWLPYALNQAGSGLFYFTLSQTELSRAVPACNALALVFSVITSWFVVGERSENPIRSVVGAALVMGGVGICLHASTTAPVDEASAR